MLQTSVLAYCNIRENSELTQFLTSIGDTTTILNLESATSTTWSWLKNDFVMVPSETFLIHNAPIIIFNLYDNLYGEYNYSYLTAFTQSNQFVNYNFFINRIPSNFDDVLIASRNDYSYDYAFMKLRGPKANQAADEIANQHLVLPVESGGNLEMIAL